MKNTFPEEKGSRKGFKEFLDKKGFYIVLLLCIAVVAGTAVYVTTRNSGYDRLDYDARVIPGEPGEEVEEENELVAEDAALSQPGMTGGQEQEDTQASAPAGRQSEIGDPASVGNNESDSAMKPQDAGSKTNKQEGAPSAPKGSSPKPSKTAAPVKQQSFQMPVPGEVILEYAMDKLVYSKTLEEWRTHPGIDLAADRGTPVKAVADGVVCDARNEQYYGISVTIDHGNGIKTVYRNLASDDAVAVNQKVKQGEVIGSIGNTAMDESSEQPHLHFEVLKNDVNADPAEYLPVNVTLE